MADAFAALDQAVTAQQGDFIKQLFNHVVDQVEREHDKDVWQTESGGSEQQTASTLIA